MLTLVLVWNGILLATDAYVLRELNNKTFIEASEKICTRKTLSQFEIFFAASSNFAKEEIEKLGCKVYMVNPNNTGKVTVETLSFINYRRIVIFYYDKDGTMTESKKRSYFLWP